MTSLPKASESMRERNRIGCVIRVNNRKTLGKSIMTRNIEIKLLWLLLLQ